MLILVTGAAGYIGSSFTRNLAQKVGRENIRAVDNFEIGTIRDLDGLRVEAADATDERQVKQMLDGVETVVHLAAYSDIRLCEKQGKNAILNNLYSVKLLLEEGRKQQLKRFIFPSSFAVYAGGHRVIHEGTPKKPYNFYGFLKHWAEELIVSYAERYGMEYVIFRQTNVVGKGLLEKGTVMNVLCRRAKEGLPLVIYGDGKQMRNFIHLKDLLLFYERALTENTGIYNLGGVDTKSVKDIAQEVAAAAEEIYGKKVAIEYRESIQPEVMKNEFQFDISKLVKDFRIRPQITVKQMIRELLV
ncbi:MAG: NAD(P)-dependent oxidoreductase [Bacillales bacterium]